MLDTDVIFSRVLHELVGRLATELRLLTLVWSDELLAEAERVLTDRKPMPAEAARRWVGYVREAFPTERVDPTRLPDVVDLAALTNDPGDRHVCALVVAGRADLLLTFDRGYLHDPLSRYGIDVQTPDQFLQTAFGEQPAAILGILRAQAAVWGGGRPIEQLLDAIERAGATTFIVAVRASLDP